MITYQYKTNLLGIFIIYYPKDIDTINNLQDKDYIILLNLRQYLNIKYNYHLH